MGYDSTLIWYDDESEATIRTIPNLYYSTYFQGLYIQNRAGHWCLRGGARANIHVSLCRFSNPQDPSIGAGVLTGAANDVVIENCVFDSIMTGFHDILGTRLTIIRNCYFNNYRNQAVALSNQKTVIENCIFSNSGTYQTAVTGVTDTLFMNNLLIYNNSSGIGCGVVDTMTCFNSTMDFYNNSQAAHAFNTGIGSKVIINNSISNIAEATYVFENRYLRLAYNNFWNVETEVYVEPGGTIDTTGGNLREYPMFIGSGDYHLQALSPLIDAGDPTIMDVDGTRSDIGVYGGPGGSSYPYLDLPPLAPDSLSAVVIADTIFLNWRLNHEADFDRYQLHRETYSGFIPSVLNLIAEPDTSYFKDTDLTPGNNYYYRIAALDNQENLSDYSEELEVITTGIDGGWGAEMPTITAIQSNYPNPFNSQTTIVYTVANLGPIPAQINIDIYDIIGRLVRRLVDGRKEVGIYRITWDGRNDSGSDCPSGIYFARILQWNVDYMARHQKLVLMK
jgi:hypothetical protein